MLQVSMAIFLWPSWCKQVNAKDQNKQIFTETHTFTLKKQLGSYVNGVYTVSVAIHMLPLSHGPAMFLHIAHVMLSRNLVLRVMKCLFSKDIT